MRGFTAAALSANQQGMDKFPRRRVLLAGLALLLPALPACAQQAPAAMQWVTLEIVTASGRHTFKAELALTSEQQSQGLMYRRELAADAGMLFDYGADRPGIAMWMKNTFIPLDMLFIKANGEILNIAERTVPQSLATIAAAGPARAVLELNGGTASRLKIRPGDKVVHPMFGNARP